jgi:hypothetical protein
MSNNSILLKTQAIGPAFEDRKDDVKKLFAGDVTLCYTQFNSRH